MDDQTLKLFLRFLSLHTGKTIQSPLDLANLSARELLQLADQLPDEALPFLVQLAKQAGSNAGLFNKLMGDHEPENQGLSDRFFARYHEQIFDSLEQEENPLLMYLPKDVWDDLGFLQSREHFFLRQTMAHIQEFLAAYFDDVPSFGPGMEREAWSWFFSKVIMG